jgi:hypothetical protein
MKNYKKRYKTSDYIKVDDLVKVAGYMYRVDRVILEDDSIAFELTSTEGLKRSYMILVVEYNRLMAIYIPK